MPTSSILLSALALFGPAFCKPTAAPNTPLITCTPRPASPREQQAEFEKYADLLYVKRTPRPAYAYFTANDTQHNPYVLDGAAASFALVNPIYINHTNGVEMLHQGFQAPIGWVHWRLDGGGYPAPTAVVDVYRFEGACIVEHWDIVQTLPADAINPHALF
ncbi:hypothetical protein C8F04DRAFT_1181055 [Mycena alexandri]|uniref:SnoaL-like domain-containing protein n=1 Tax=Mycena alexandri TaxID=1745969 RepID=A0AAD6SZT1_9AGAR|nr:hypothetical protein C8F04DRAFT_1181055 [Mycena alexandri]